MDLRGTLTILEDAGTASETRRDVPFQIAQPDLAKQTPIAKVQRR